MGKPTSYLDLYVGLAGIDLSGHTVDFGEGITLRPTFCHLFSTEMLAFEKPTSTPHHPGPWRALTSRPGVDVVAELAVPGSYNHHKLSNLEVAHTLVSLIRLYSDPAVSIQLISPRPISELKIQTDDEKPGSLLAMLYQHRKRFVDFRTTEPEKAVDSLHLTVSDWKTCVNLRSQSSEFDFALSTFEEAQCLSSTAMMMVSVWGALEAIFAPHKAELSFRVSAQLAAFLSPRGPERLAMQNRIKKMYGLRSAAAHGPSSHDETNVLDTFLLLRGAILRMIKLRGVPSRDQLEELLFS